MSTKYFLPPTAIVVYNALIPQVPYPLAPLTDDDTVSMASKIQTILIKSGVKSQLLPFANLADLKNLKKLKTELIVNCLEDDIADLAGSFHLLPQAAAEVGVPVTGGSAENIILTTNKITAKQLFIKFGIPTPPFKVIAELGDLNSIDNFKKFFPAIVKPEATDGSEGITQKSVVNNYQQLKRQCLNIKKVFRQNSLVEKFIDGREVSISILEMRKKIKLFPIAELVFSPRFKPAYRIIDFKAKWRLKSNQCQETSRVCPAQLPPKLINKLTLIAKKIWRVFNLQGYARIDFRIDAQNNVYVLDINVNPDLTNDANTAFPSAAKAAGLSYEDLILAIVDSALYRYQSV